MPWEARFVVSTFASASTETRPEPRTMSGLGFTFMVKPSGLIDRLSRIFSW